MVIKMTFRDSDLVHYLEEFCNRLTWRMFDTNIGEAPDSIKDDIGEYTKWAIKQIEYCNLMKEKQWRLMNPRHHFPKGGVDQKEIIAEVLRLWKIYDEEHSIGYTPQVSIQYGVKEHWENGEVLYYFTATDQCICM
jgi:hypothetical protein